jgi:hypothetical protein
MECRCCKHGTLTQMPLRRPTAGERLYARLYPKRRMFFLADIARMEELDRLIAAGRITEDGRPVIKIGDLPLSAEVQ